MTNIFSRLGLGGSHKMRHSTRNYARTRVYAYIDELVRSRAYPGETVENEIVDTPRGREFK